MSTEYSDGKIINNDKEILLPATTGIVGKYTPLYEYNVTVAWNTDFKDNTKIIGNFAFTFLSTNDTMWDLKNINIDTASTTEEKRKENSKKRIETFGTFLTSHGFKSDYMIYGHGRQSNNLLNAISVTFKADGSIEAIKLHREGSDTEAELIANNRNIKINAGTDGVTDKMGFSYCTRRKIF